MPTVACVASFVDSQLRGRMSSSGALPAFTVEAFSLASNSPMFPELPSSSGYNPYRQTRPIWERIFDPPTPRHRVFVSYQHIQQDQQWRDRFEHLFDKINDVFISNSVQVGEINPYLSTDTIRQKIRDEYLRDSTVTLVLVGPTTWQRKHVDWEISSSIRHTELNPRSGLIGILLPNHPDYGAPFYTRGLAPPRLHDNIVCKFAKLYDWTESPEAIRQWIEEAFNRRLTVTPDNSFEHFVNNKWGPAWY